MTTDECIEAIHEAVPGSKVGMIEHENGQFEVWAKADHKSLGYASGTTLSEALVGLKLLVEREAGLRS